MKEKGLREIFDFYCKQHIMQGNKMSFDEIGKEGTRMAYGDYIKLCADFLIPLKKEQLTEIYRVRVKRGNQAMEFSTFKELMSDAFRAIHEEKVNAKKQDLELLKLRQLDIKLNKGKKVEPEQKIEDEHMGEDGDPHYDENE